MRINEANKDITVSQWDYGVPVEFELEPEDGVSLAGDSVILAFDGDRIADRVKVMTDDDTTISFALTEEEANEAFGYPIASREVIPYSLKRYRAGQYLDTLLNGKLIITRAVKWQ